jgi:hypothetical protein
MKDGINKSCSGLYNPFQFVVNEGELPQNKNPPGLAAAVG